MVVPGRCGDPGGRRGRDQVRDPAAHLGRSHVADRDVPRVRRDPHRHRSGGQLRPLQHAGARNQEDIDEYIEANGLYEGFGGYVRGYFTWLGGFLTGDWPNSIKGNREVWPNLKDAMANSLRLAGIAAIIGIVIGCTFGVFAALKPGSLRDGSVNTTALVDALDPAVRHGRDPADGVRRLHPRSGSPKQEWLHFPTSGVYPPGQQGFDLVEMLRHLDAARDRRGHPDESPSTPATCGPRCSTC